jgi:hypothetical protein
MAEVTSDDGLSLEPLEALSERKFDRPEEAIAALEAGLVAEERLTDPPSTKHRRILRAKLLLRLSEAYEKSAAGQDFEKALAALGKALQSSALNEDDPPLWAQIQHSLGRVYLQQIRDDRADNIEGNRCLRGGAGRPHARGLSGRLGEDAAESGDCLYLLHCKLESRGQPPSHWHQYLAMFKLSGSTIVVLLLAATLAAAQPACLPKSVFAKNRFDEFPLIDLGYIDNVLTLCAYERMLDPINPTPRMDKLLGCWTVDPTAGALGPSAARAIPGQGRRIGLDAQGCFNSYCIAPIPADDNRPFFATSTDGAHAAILTERLLYIFTTNTKAKVAEIDLVKQDAPDDTNVGNEPWGLLYNGDTLFVIGTDAGPFTAVWVFKDNGSRLGMIGTDEDALNIFNGGYGILGRDKVALVDAGLQNMTTVTGANAAKQSAKRTASYAPCTKDQFERWTRSEEIKTGACKRVLDAKYQPYVDMSPVQLPSGDIITPLSGPAQGYIAVLNPVGLTEKHRLKLAHCP